MLLGIIGSKPQTLTGPPPAGDCIGPLAGLLLDGPVPWFVGYAEPIIARIGHRETEAASVPHEPTEGRHRLEPFRQWRAAWRRQVHGSARMVLAVTWRRVYLQNLLQGLAGGDLSLENLPLILQAAEGRDEL